MPRNANPEGSRAALQLGQCSRRVWLRTALTAAGLLSFAGTNAGCASSLGELEPADADRRDHFSAIESAFLTELERRGCLFFWEASNPATGLTKDRVRADGGSDSRKIASIAATGFALTGLCVAAERRFQPMNDIRDRVRTTLRFLRNELPHEHGFYFHFVDWQTGERLWNCELSSIDTALLLCGVVSCGEYFAEDAEIRRLAREIYERVDWLWMLAGGSTLSHGWKPESGFLRNRWDHYCELMLLYLLALGSSTHPIPATSWDEWARPLYRYYGLEYVGSSAPLFVHQYAQAWFDFRNRRDAYADYFANSIIATRAHRLFCLKLRDRFPQFGEDLWGITSSDSAKGYVAWGGPPEMGPLDGTVVPCAAAGSLPFLPRESLRSLRSMRERFGDRIWKRYGFVDAFNPHRPWFNPDVIGIDVGITVLMAENVQTGFVWRTFMRSEAARRGMVRAGFKKSSGN